MYFEYLLAPTKKHAAEAVAWYEEKERQARLEKVRSWLQAGVPVVDVDREVAGDVSSPRT